MKWKCKECDSEYLEQLAWININTDKLNDYQDGATIWCCECGAEDSAIEVNEKKKSASTSIISTIGYRGEE